MQVSVFKKLYVQRFYEGGNVFNVFVRPQGYTQCILLRNTDCKHNFCLFAKKTPQGIIKERIENTSSTAVHGEKT